MNISLVNGAVLLMFLIITACAFADGAETPLDVAKKYCGQMTTTGRETISRGEQKNTKDTVISLKKWRDELARGYSKVEQAMLSSADVDSKSKGREAMGRLDKASERILAAIRHGEAGRHDDMMKAAREGMVQADEICSLVNAMK